MPKKFCKTFEYIEIPLTDAGIQKSCIYFIDGNSLEVYRVLQAPNGFEYALRILYHSDKELKSCREVMLTPEVRWYSSNIPEIEKDVVEHARRLLKEREYHLAAFMVRDLECTKAAELRDYAWALNSAGSISYNDVAGLLEPLEEYIRNQQ